MKTISNDPALSGSIVLVKGETFLSKQIMMHMAIYARMTGRKPVKYSHAETLWYNDYSKRMYTIGAREKGTEMSWADSYYEGKEILILKPRIALTQIESDNLFIYCEEVDKSKYQTGNFLSWITYLKTGIWLSKKGDNRTYCYELAARCANVTGRWPKSKPLDMVSIYDLVELTDYEIYEP